MLIYKMNIYEMIVIFYQQLNRKVPKRPFRLRKGPPWVLPAHYLADNS